MISIRFERHSYKDGIRDIEEEVILGPFDWIESEGRMLIAEADNGNLRFETLAYQDSSKASPWMTEDDRQWDYYVIGSWNDSKQSNYIGDK